MTQDMNTPNFASFFKGEALSHLYEVLAISLKEDGQDLTSLGIFEENALATAQITCKQEGIMAGFPIIPLLLELAQKETKKKFDYSFTPLAKDGDFVSSGTVIARYTAPVSFILSTERVILNMLSHLSGIATLTNQYVKALEGTSVRLLDTRKTLPGLRYPEKYAVLCGGGTNHRLNLADMLMLKDNHIDAKGSITEAVAALKQKYCPCPPIEVECQSIAQVQEAITCPIERIMLDNMNKETLAKALPLIPQSIEAEISGNVELATIYDLATVCKERPPDFISVGRITHSAPSIDLSMRIVEK